MRLSVSPEYHFLLKGKEREGETENVVKCLYAEADAAFILWAFFFFMEIGVGLSSCRLSSGDGAESQNNENSFVVH